MVSPAALRSLRTVARRLPGACLTALELRLAAGRERVDLAVRLRPNDARAVAERLAAEEPPAEPARFLRRWSRQTPELAPVRSVWLELDLERESAGRLEPVTCVELAPRAEIAWLLETLLPALRGEGTSDARTRLIRRCIIAVPAAAELLYVFDLRARGSDAVRLELHRLDPATMVVYLESLGDDHAAAAARRVAALAPLVAGCDRYHLSLDVGEEIAPRVGVEASFRRLPHREPGWAALISRLVEGGLCDRAKGDALLVWPGWDSPRTASDRWPAAANRPGIFCARALSHVKLVSRPDRPPEAKAYLLFQPLAKGSVPSR